jgi:hypothetical protein
MCHLEKPLILRGENSRNREIYQVVPISARHVLRTAQQNHGTYTVEVGRSPFTSAIRKEWTAPC